MAGIRPLPEEVLVMIMDYVRDLDVSDDTMFATRCNFRLPCRAFSRVGLSAMAKKITTLYFSPHQHSASVFWQICQDPILRKKIKHVIYVGNVFYNSTEEATELERGMKAWTPWQRRQRKLQDVRSRDRTKQYHEMIRHGTASCRTCEQYPTADPACLKITEHQERNMDLITNIPSNISSVDREHV